MVHNYYGSSAPSGENKVFEAEKTMLERHGEMVAVYARHSDEIRLFDHSNCLIVQLWKRMYGLAKGALCTIGNPFAARALARKIREFRPDVIHFHNQFPLISPLAIRAAHKSGAKVVMTLHNYRTVCAAGVPTRCGHVCRDCFPHLNNLNKLRNRTILPALRHRCYRGSFLATFPLAINIWLYRRCWAKWVDRFICLTPFAREMMISAGFPAAKIVVKANFVSGGDEVKVSGGGEQRKAQVLYVGRLSEEKGVRTLVEAWNLMANEAPELVIVGDGDCRGEYEKLAMNPKIRFVGQKPHEDVMRAVAEARLVVIPSMCYEGLPTNLMEAFMLGTPCLVSDLGALPSLVKGCGLTFRAGDSKSLSDGVMSLISDKRWEEMSKCAQQVAKECYSEQGNYEALVKIYAGIDR